jgi:hypothetical protein
MFWYTENNRRYAINSQQETLDTIQVVLVTARWVTNVYANDKVDTVGSC